MVGVIRNLDRLVGYCDRAFLFLAVAMLATMLATNVANIFCRNILGFTLLWVFGLTQVLFVWANFLVFFVLYRRNRDISVEFFVKKLPAAGQTFARYLTYATVLFVTGTLLIEAPGILELQVGPISESVSLERYFLSIPLFAAAFLILLDMVLHVAGDLTNADLPPRGSGHAAPGNDSEDNA